MRLRQQPEGIGNFNPRPPRGGRLGLLPHLLHALGFQSTPPARGATVKMKVRRWSMSISIHAPREGGDSRMYTLSAASKISIHAPREGGDGGINYPPPYKEDLNPRPPRGGRRFVRIVSLSLPIISIHAPREGGDPEYGYVLGGCHGISIHAPREGGDNAARRTSEEVHHFNPRPPRGGRRPGLGPCAIALRISIHAPREGGDAIRAARQEAQAISIHAPREGGDNTRPPIRQ